VQKYHFTLLRNLYEKTASFLGYPRWSKLLPDDKQAYLNRIIQFTSHSTLSNEAVTQPSEPEKKMVALLLNHLVTNYNFWQQEKQHASETFIGFCADYKMINECNIKNTAYLDKTIGNI